MTTVRTRRMFTTAVAVGLSATLAACSSSSAPSAAGKKTTSADSGGTAASTTMRTVNVAVTSDGCAAEHLSYATGPLTFAVKNTDATGVSEFELLNQDRILGEKENLVPGFGGSFSLNLAPGTYTLYCPGATVEKKVFTVTGTATSTPATNTHALLVNGAKGYLGYVRVQVANLKQQVVALDAAVKAGNVKAAQLAYVKARPMYERIEPVAESFPSLDAAIDERADDTPVTKITGFHRIEYGLFAKKSTTGLAPISAALLANVNKLIAVTVKLTGFQAAEVANGAGSLLDEAAKTKITGEEERYSHIDLVDFASNVEGSQQAFAYLEPGLTKIDAALVARIRAAFARVTALLEDYRAPAQPSGFKLYPQLTQANLQSISQALLAVREPLSTVAGKVVSA